MEKCLAMACVFSNIPGPPSIQISNLTFQLWSIDKRKCEIFDTERDTVFHLYTYNNPNNSEILIPHNDISLINSEMDFSRQTIIFFHGFLESYLSEDAQTIKNAYLYTEDYNVILVDSSRLLAGPNYFVAAKNCKPIGRYTAEFLDYLVSKGLRLDLVHVIGLSLGAHIAGFTGKFLKSGKLPRITALDPAGPLFNEKPPDERLDPSKAKFVDVIYTNSGLFGMKYPVGHANYYPNGGSKQPGCDFMTLYFKHNLAINWIVFCHHYRSYQYYAISVRYPTAFPSKKCCKGPNKNKGNKPSKSPIDWFLMDLNGSNESTESPEPKNTTMIIGDIEENPPTEGPDNFPGWTFLDPKPTKPTTNQNPSGNQALVIVDGNEYNFHETGEVPVGSIFTPPRPKPPPFITSNVDPNIQGPYFLHPTPPTGGWSIVNPRPVQPALVGYYERPAQQTVFGYQYSSGPVPLISPSEQGVYRSGLKNNVLKQEGFKRSVLPERHTQHTKEKISYMGFAAKPGARGNYYLRTPPGLDL